MTAGLTGRMFIGHHRLMGTAGTARSVAPATGERLEPPYGMDDGTGVAAACRAAAAAFDPYRALDDAHRAGFLARAAANLDAARADIVHCVHEETALPVERAGAELTRTTTQLRMFADLLGTPGWRGERHAPPSLRMRRIPVGPVAVFGAANFPLAFSVAGGDTAAALAAGCPVVVKAHPAHPRTSELAATCLDAAAGETGIPDGVFSLVYGAGTETGQQLAADPHIAAVAFTGSRAGGTALLAAAQRRPVPIPVFAEMSSVNPVFVLPHRLALAATPTALGFLTSLTTGAGQFCTNPGLVLVVEGPGLDEFRATVRDALSTVAAQTMLTADIARGYRDTVRRYDADPAVVRIAGRPPAADASATGPFGAGPAVFETTAATFAATPWLGEEVFGPASVLVVCGDAAELTDTARSLTGQLTASVHAGPDDTPLARDLLRVLELRAGRIVVDGWPTGVEVGPATVHGGPYPATFDPRFTSVGTMAIDRFLRPVCYQGVPDPLLG